MFFDNNLNSLDNMLLNQLNKKTPEKTKVSRKKADEQSSPTARQREKNEIVMRVPASLPG